MQRLDFSHIRFSIALIAVTGVILVILRSNRESQNSTQEPLKQILSESTQMQLEFAVRKLEETQGKLRKYKERCVVIREAYRKHQIYFPKAHSRYTSLLTASIERAMRGENPDRIPRFEDELRAHQQRIDTHEMRLNNLQPAIEDLVQRIDVRISQIEQFNQQIAPVKPQVSENDIESNSIKPLEQRSLLERYEQLSVLIQDDLPRWGREIKDHRSFLRELSLFIQSIPD